MAAKFTNSASEALQQAQAEAIRREHQELTPEHLLLAMISSDPSESAIVPNILVNSGVSIPALRATLENGLKKTPSVSGGGGQIYPSNSLSRILVLAEDEAKALSD